MHKIWFWSINWLSKSSNSVTICPKNPKCRFVLAQQQQYKTNMQNQFGWNKSTFYTQTEQYLMIISLIASYQPRNTSCLVQVISNCNIKYISSNYVPKSEALLDSLTFFPEIINFDYKQLQELMSWKFLETIRFY